MCFCAPFVLRGVLELLLSLGKKEAKRGKKTLPLFTFRRSSIQRETSKRERKKVSLSLSLSRNNTTNAPKRFRDETTTRRRRRSFFLRPHQFIRGGWCVRVESGGRLLKEPKEREEINHHLWVASDVWRCRRPKTQDKRGARKGDLCFETHRDRRDLAPL